jgi:hypothetical protein
MSMPFWEFFLVSEQDLEKLGMSNLTRETTGMGPQCQDEGNVSQDGQIASRNWTALSNHQGG